MSDKRSLGKARAIIRGSLSELDSSRSVASLIGNQQFWDRLGERIAEALDAERLDRDRLTLTVLEVCAKEMDGAQLEAVMRRREFMRGLYDGLEGKVDAT